jgi:hypothetical protein
MGFERDRLPDPMSYFEAEGLRLKGPNSSKWKTTDFEVPRRLGNDDS